MTTQNDLITTAQNSTATAAAATTTLLTTKKPTAADPTAAATTPTTIGYRSTTLPMSSTAPTITTTGVGVGVGVAAGAVPATKSAQIGLTGKATTATPATTPKQTLATATATATTRTATTMATMFISTIYPTSTTEPAVAASRPVPGLPLLSGRASLTSETDAHDSIEMATSLASGEENTVLSLPHPDSADALTKGFSIPTFLPPFPVFAAADLPAYRAAADAAEAAEAAAAAAAAAAASTMASETVTLSPEQEREQMFNEQHSYLASHNGQLQPGQLPRRNLTMPVLNITAQMGNHAYMPCQVSTKPNLSPSSTTPSPQGSLACVQRHRAKCDT